MKGAREYAKLFKTGQYGKLYITVGQHARGYFFHIHVLPDGEDAIPNGESNPCINDNAVEVYGITGGNPGWSEEYGWLHQGRWQQDFYRLVEERKEKIATEEKTRIEEIKKEKDAEYSRTNRLLADY